MENKNKTILDLAGGSGAWSAPYKEAGYDVRLITLPGYDVTVYHPPKNVYGILAAPPCTEFSKARTRAKEPRDLKKGMLIVKACLNIIWECRYNPQYQKDGALKFWAFENPYNAFLQYFLGRPSFIFHPWEFGDEYSKITALWGWFNLPKKIKKEYILSKNDKQNNMGKYKSILEITSSKQSDIRSVTPPGFAKAFFKANK